MSQVLLVLLLEGWDLLPCEFRVRFGFLFRWNSVPPIREGLFSRFCHFFFLFYLRMAQLMSAPWIACGAVRFDSCEHKNSRGFRNGWNVGVSRPRTDFLATCEVRPSLCSRRSSSRSGLRLVESHQGRDEVGVVAGLIEETEETLISEGAGGDGVAVVTAEANVDLNVDDLGNNTRKVEATIAIQAPLEAVWGVLTDYDHLADHIPGLAESSVLQRRSNGARLKQIGQKNFALGVKFKAKAVVEVTEEAAQDLDDGTLRDLHFETVEGDFQVFKGTWRMLEKSLESNDAIVETYLSYILEVQPKRWMPVALIEGVLGQEITCNLISVRNVALRIHNSL